MCADVMEGRDLCVDGLRLVAAEEAEGAVETAADRGVVLEERAEMPLQEDNVNEM